MYAAANALLAKVPTDGKFRHRKSSYILEENLRVTKKYRQNGMQNDCGNTFSSIYTQVIISEMVSELHRQ